MFRRDMQAARNLWIKEAEGNPAELTRRTESEFLTCESADGQRADFHAFRHSFISLLASSGVHPKIAQMLARHATITLTMDRYSHLPKSDLSQVVNGIPSLLTTPEPDGYIGIAATPSDVSCCPPCCPADDFSCQSLTTVAESSPLSVTTSSREIRGKSHDIDTFSQCFPKETEMNRGKPSSENVSDSE